MIRTIPSRLTASTLLLPTGSMRDRQSGGGGDGGGGGGGGGGLEDGCRGCSVTTTLRRTVGVVLLLSISRTCIFQRYGESTQIMCLHNAPVTFKASSNPLSSACLRVCLSVCMCPCACLGVRQCCCRCVTHSKKTLGNRQIINGRQLKQQGFLS